MESNQYVCTISQWIGSCLHPLVLMSTADKPGSVTGAGMGPGG
jgi:hypothetical protein